jgi:hypothetical protein
MEYEKRIIAFIDILGFKNKVKESEKGSSILNTIDSPLNYLFAWETGQQNKWDYKFIQSEPDVNANKTAYDIAHLCRCICFSDCFVVSIPYVCTTVHRHFSTFVSNLARICWKFMQAGMPLRGGITIGNLVHTEKVIYGPAMVDAVQLEKSAIYPRIILSKDLIEKLKFPHNPIRPYNKLLARFADGCVGFSAVNDLQYRRMNLRIMQ